MPRCSKKKKFVAVDIETKERPWWDTDEMRAETQRQMDEAIRRLFYVSPFQRWLRRHTNA